MKDVRAWTNNRIRTLEMAISAADEDIRHMYTYTMVNQTIIERAQFFRHEFQCKLDAFNELLSFLDTSDENQS